VTLSDGQAGYIPSGTKGHEITSNIKRRLDEAATVYSSPVSTSVVVAHLQAGVELTVEASVTFAGAYWDAVVLSNGKTGYICGTTTGHKAGRLEGAIDPPPSAEPHDDSRYMPRG
jgi:hypothetical protein